jgi:predicted Zn-dependent protease
MLPGDAPVEPPTEEVCADRLGFKAPATFAMIALQLNVVADPPSRAILEAAREKLRTQFEGDPEARWREDLADAVAMRPHDWRLRHQLFELLQAAGEHEAAFAEAETLYQQQPHLRVARRARAQSLMATGRATEARAALEELLALYPDDPAGQHISAMWSSLAAAP